MSRTHAALPQGPAAAGAGAQRDAQGPHLLGLEPEGLRAQRAAARARRQDRRTGRASRIVPGAPIAPRGSRARRPLTRNPAGATAVSGRGPTGPSPGRRRPARSATSLRTPGRSRRTGSARRGSAGPADAELRARSIRAASAGGSGRVETRRPPCASPLRACEASTRPTRITSAPSTAATRAMTTSGCSGRAKRSSHSRDTPGGAC